MYLRHLFVIGLTIGLMAQKPQPQGSERKGGAIGHHADGSAGPQQSPESATPRIEPDLLSASTRTDLVDVFVVLADQPHESIRDRHFKPVSAQLDALHAQAASEFRRPGPVTNSLRHLVERRDRLEMQTRLETIREIREATRTSHQALETQLRAIGALPVQYFWILNMMNVRLPGTMIPTLAALPGVLTVKKAYQRRPSFSSVEATGAFAFHDAGYRGSTQTALLLDSGINASHPWFGSLPIEARVKLESARNRDCFDDNADDASDMFNHGTAVAAIMASSDPVGMAPELGRLVSYKVVAKGKDDPRCAPTIIEEADWISAIEEALGEFPVSVINMSFGGNPGAEDDLAMWVTDRVADLFDISIAAAAGNDGTSSRLYQVDSPAAGWNVTAVGNIDHNDTVTRDDDVPNPTSSGGKTPSGRFKPDVGAPGTRIVSADGHSNGTTDPLSGTSFAAPHVAGGLILMADAGVSSSLARRALLMNSTPVPQWVDKIGLGEIDLGSAFAQRGSVYTDSLKLRDGRYVGLYAGKLDGLMRAILVWNRHIQSIDPAANRAAWYLTNLNLSAYFQGDANLSVVSASPRDNWEGIWLTGTDTVVFKVDIPPQSTVSADSENYAIAFSDPSFQRVNGPELQVSCIPDRDQVMIFGIVNLDCVVRNTGDVSLPRNAPTQLQYTNPWNKQQFFFNLPALASGQETRQRITLTVPLGAATGSTAVDLRAVTNSFGEIWEWKANANAFTVIPVALQDCTPDFKVNANFPLTADAQNITATLRFPKYQPANPGICAWLADPGSFVHIFNSVNTPVVQLTGTGDKDLTFQVDAAPTNTRDATRSAQVTITITSRIDGQGAPPPTPVNPPIRFTVTQNYRK
jgi:hypothetical protein